MLSFRKKHLAMEAMNFFENFQVLTNKILVKEITFFECAFSCTLL